jgi:hypothetical protein
LLIACANISGLLLARTTARRKELTVPSRIGGGSPTPGAAAAHRGAIDRCLGGRIGIGMGLLGNSTAAGQHALQSSHQRRCVQLGPQRTAFATGATLVCLVLFGWRRHCASRTDITTNLTASRGRSHTRFRTALVAFEIALPCSGW